MIWKNELKGVFAPLDLAHHQSLIERGHEHVVAIHSRDQATVAIDTEMAQPLGAAWIGEPQPLADKVAILVNIEMSGEIHKWAYWRLLSPSVPAGDSVPSFGEIFEPSRKRINGVPN